MVKEPPKAVIVISGAANLTRLVYEFERGLRIFQDVHIYSTSQSSSSIEEEEEYDDDEEEDKEETTSVVEKTTTRADEKGFQGTTERMFTILLLYAEPCLGVFVFVFFFKHLNVPFALSYHAVWKQMLLKERVTTCREGIRVFCDPFSNVISTEYKFGDSEFL